MRDYRQVVRIYEACPTPLPAPCAACDSIAKLLRREVAAALREAAQSLDALADESWDAGSDSDRAYDYLWNEAKALRARAEEVERHGS